MTFPYIRPYNIHTSVDNTPNNITWQNVVWTDLTSANITSKQITGITSGIYIQIQPGAGSAPPTLYYQISTNQVTGTITSQPTSPWASVTSNTTVIVSGNQWLSFTCHGDVGGFNDVTRIATAVNLSDNNTILGSGITFSFTYTSSPAPT